MIGLGIVTYNRPEYFKQSIQGVIDHLLDICDVIYVYNDGSDPKYEQAYQDIYATLPDKVHVTHAATNGGVAVAKNHVMQSMLDAGCDYLFVMEDDVMPISRNAIVMYLAAYKMTGIDHMMFAHHGPANRVAEALIDMVGPIQYWWSCVGAWCFYTKEILEKVGLMDEQFINAWEHVEHTWRIYNYHNMPYGYYPDIVGSKEYIAEIPGAMEHSSIGSQDNVDRLKVIVAGLEHWQQKDEDFPAEHQLTAFREKLKRFTNNPKSKRHTPR